MDFNHSHSHSNEDSFLGPYNLALLLVAIATLIYLIRRAESRNRLHYDSRFSRILSGFIRMSVNTWHTKEDDVEITDTEGKILAIGPHRTGIVDASVVTSKMKGTPPSFLVTDAYNHIPGVSSIIRLLKGIPVKAIKDPKSSGDGVLEQAGKVLDENGCVAIFPQGNFAKLGQEPPRIYEGAARLALSRRAPIHVIRLDGFWSIDNPLLPVFIRNNSYYRSMLSALHMNSVRVTKCDVIDFHLKNEGDQNDEKKIINEICAELYAYFRHTNELTARQIPVVKREISDKTHLTIWASKVEQGVLKKQLDAAAKEEVRLSEPTSMAMKNC